MIFNTKKLFVFETVFAVFILLKGNEACFEDATEPFDIDDITTGSPLYKECECTEPGYTVDNLQWLDPNGHVITDTGLNVHIEKNGNKLALLIKSASKTMSGTYKCVATSNGAVHSQSHRVNVYDPLDFINTESVQYLSEGNDSLIRCQTVGDYVPMIHWFKSDIEDIMLKSNEKFYINNSLGLIVKKVTKDDADIYRCLAEEQTFGQRVERIIKVEVLTIPIIKELSAQPEATVGVGEKLRLTCVAEGLPDPEYSWRRVPEINQFGDEPKNATWTQMNNVIEFANIAANDTGTYECLATNTVGTTTAAITIDVLVGPQIVDFNNITVVEGNQVAIVCGVTGNPPPEVSIVYEGKSLIEEEEGEEYERPLENFAVLTANRSNEGIYVCNASNIVDYETEIIYLKVLHKPYFKQGDEKLWGWNGNEVQLNCAYDSSPQAKLTWSYQNDISMVADLDVSDMLNRANSAEHTFMIDGNFSLYGIFRCRAINEYGEAYKTIELIKGFPPSGVHNLSIIDLTATSVTFSVEIPYDFIGPDVIGITAEYDETRNYEITDIHKNRTWSLDRPFKLEKLRPNTTYSVRVAAINVIGNGEWSEMIDFNTLEKSAPEPPVWPDPPLVVTPTNHLIKWKAPDDNGDPIDYYILRYCPISDQIDEELCEGVRIVANTELELGNLQYNTSYRFELVAHNSEGNSTVAEVLVTVPARLENSQGPPFTAGVLIAIAIVVVIICLLLLDLLFFFWKRQGIIASCCHKKNKKKNNESLNSRDKKGLLKDNTEVEDTSRRPNNGHKEYEYNKTTGIITGKHSAV